MEVVKELNLDKLESLALKATPGPWWASQHKDWAHPVTTVDDETGRRVTFYNDNPEYSRFMFHGTRGKAELEWANAEFIAAANPMVILEMIERLRIVEEIANE